MENYRDNLQIDLKDMTKYILKFWKKIMLFTIIGAILGGAYSYIAPPAPPVDETADAATAPPDPAKDTKNLSKQPPKLTETEMQEVELALDTYEIYQNAREIVRQDLLNYMDSYDPNGELDKDQSEELMYKFNSLQTTTVNQLTSGSAMYGALNEDQRIVFDMKIGRIVDDGTKEELITIEDGEIPLNAEPVSAKTHIKYAILGAFMCAFAVLMILAAKYTLSPKLKTENDLRSAFKLPMLGSISKNNNDGLALVSKSILTLAAGKKAGDIIMCSSLSEEKAEYMSQIKKYLTDNKASVDIANSILSDTDSLDKVTSSAGLILFERTWESTYENIEKEVELAKNLGLNILGAVVIK